MNRPMQFVLVGLTILVVGRSALCQDVGVTAREVWVAIRMDKKAGTGNITDPFDGSSVEKLNALFKKFSEEYGDKLTVHFGPGVFYGDRLWEPKSDWKIRGAGMDVTVFKSRLDPDGIGTVGFRAGGRDSRLSGFELSDCTFDFNTPNLRKANRAFVFSWWGNSWQVSYFYSKGLEEWSPEKEYGRRDAIIHKGVEYMAIGASKGQEPAQGSVWSVMHPNRPGQLPAWKKDKAYALGDAVELSGNCYICIAPNATSEPATDKGHWQALNPNAPDPLIYTNASFMHTRPPDGRHRVSRVKAINGNGSFFFDKEDFVIGLGGNDNVVENCIVEQFHGDYATLIVVSMGQHGVVRGCTVRGNNGLVTMAYGGWACWDTVFEDNFCSDVRSATNIDSLNCRNVTFRNNVFMNCREAGILVNVSGGFTGGPRPYSIVIGGKTVVDFTRNCMDGLFIYNNLVEICDGAIHGGIQAQSDGLANVRISNNVIRTTSGQGNARAIVVFGKATNVAVCDNTCEPGMYCEVTPVTICRGNYDFLNQPMKDPKGQPIDLPPKP